MNAKVKLSRLVSIVIVLMMTASGLAILPLTGGEQRATVDASAIGFPSHKDIDDPNPPAIQYPPSNTAITATVKNSGTSPISGQFPVTMEVGKGSPETRFYEDAEGPWKPAGWSVTDFTGGKWHVTNKTYASAETSAWCGLEGQSVVQYGSNWAESLTTTNSVLVPNAGAPSLLFNHYYSTKFNTDGGYVEIRNMSVSPERWDRNVSGNWSFTSLGYNGTTAIINPAQTGDSWCFCGESNGWQLASINLARYAGYFIKVRFVFSSSSNTAGTLNGWFIDDVRITDSVTTPLQDSFDTMANWTAVNMKGSGNVPPGWGQQNGGNPSNNTGVKCFTNNNPANGAYSDGEDSALVTPPVSLANSTNARLYFWYKIQSQAFNDGGFIEVQRAGGDWYPLQVPWLRTYGGSLDSKSPYGGKNAYSANANQWFFTAFDLSRFSGSTVQIRFHFFANDDGNTGFGWYLDEISVVAWNFTVSGSSQANAPALAAGATTNLNFQFMLTQEGYYSFKLITALPGDLDGSNDAFTIIIEVRKILKLDMTFSQNSVNIIHGRTQNINVSVHNRGNMANNISVRVVSSPLSWNVSLKPTNINGLPAGATANVSLQVSVPVNETSSAFFIITVNATSTLAAAETSQKNISVQVINGRPTARAGSDQNALVFVPVFFDGSSSTDPEDNATLNYTWNLGDGSPVQYGVKVNHVYTKAATYNVTLNVSDGGPGSFDVAGLKVIIGDKPPIPVIDIITHPDNGTFQINSSVEFDGSGSGDELPGELTFEWDFGDGLEKETGPKVSHNFTEAGAYNVTLTVTDSGGQSKTSDPKRVVINDYPVAKISMPLPNAFFLTTDDILFSSNGSYDPDGDQLTFEWLDNQPPGLVLSTLPYFSRKINVTGSHQITLKVYDGHGKLSTKDTIVRITVNERTNVAPTLQNGAVTPKEGDEGLVFNYTVRYSDENNDPPLYINIIIDSPRNAPQGMLAVDPLDNNYADGKDYYFNPAGAMLKGQDTPHNFSFETADRHGSGRVATGSYDGPVVRWYRLIGKDSWMPDVVPGRVYLTGNYRTFLSGVNITPPEIPQNNLSLGLAFVMNTTTPAEKWFWANVTIKYTSLNYSLVCESTLKVWWSVDGQPWTTVPISGLDMDGQFLWLNVTKPNAKYAVFGTPLPKPPKPPVTEKPADYTLVFAGIGVAVAAGAGAGLFLMMRKKRQAPPEPEYDQMVEHPTEKAVPAKKRTTARAVEEAPAVVATSGESVKMFKPAGAEVAIFRPGEGQRTKVFRPGGVDEPVVATPGTEAEEKIFKPESKDFKDGESAEGPVVQEEAVRERVVEYSDEKPPEDEELDKMPGARSAEEEIEEVEGKKPISKPKDAGARDAKFEVDSLDDLMKELDK